MFIPLQDKTCWNKIRGLVYKYADHYLCESSPGVWIEEACVSNINWDIGLRLAYVLSGKIGTHLKLLTSKNCMEVLYRVGTTIRWDRVFPDISLEHTKWSSPAKVIAPFTFYPLCENSTNVVIRFYMCQLVSMRLLKPASYPLHSSCHMNHT